MADCETPSFARIREKRTRRLSPYSENEIWDRDELLCIVNSGNLEVVARMHPNEVGVPVGCRRGK
jgi:hypothetical protein